MTWQSSATELTDPRVVVGLMALMTGISFAVHFGLFDLLAGLWRYCGADCRKLFRAPFLSRSLTEFWSRRWNVAFSEMTALAVFRPVKARLGGRIAQTAAFLFSGLLHELAISVPVQAGYGMPFCLLRAARVCDAAGGDPSRRRPVATPHPVPTRGRPSGFWSQSRCCFTGRSARACCCHYWEFLSRHSDLFRLSAFRPRLFLAEVVPVL